MIYLVIYLLALFPVVSPFLASSASESASARTFNKKLLSISRPSPSHIHMSNNKALDIDSRITAGERTSLLVNHSPSTLLLEFIQHAATSLKRGVALNELTDKPDAIEVLFADKFQQMDKTGKQQVHRCFLI